MKDEWGLEWSTHSEECRDAIASYVKEVLRYGDNWKVIEKAVRSDPECLAAHVLYADFVVVDGSQEDVVQALKRARSLLQTRAVTQREILLLEACEAWLLQHDTQKAYELYKEIVASYPSDLFALKRGQLLAFLRGDTESMLGIIDSEPVIQANKEKQYFQGMYAFALEENDRVNEAEVAAKKGVEILSSDPWSQHTEAHILLAKGQILEGRAWSRSFSFNWTNFMPFMTSHNWWHLALFELELGNYDEVLRILRTKIWIPDFRTSSEVQLDALGMIFRLKLRMNMEDLPIKSEWKMPQEHIMAKRQEIKETLKEIMDAKEWDAKKQGTPLYDVLLWSALVDLGREDPAYLKKVEDSTEVPAVIETFKAFEAYTRGDDALLLRLLRPAVTEKPKLRALGGSSEQLDCIIELYMDRAIASSHWDEARELLESRLADRPNMISMLKQLLHVYHSLELPEREVEISNRLDAVCSGVKAAIEHDEDTPSLNPRPRAIEDPID